MKNATGGINDNGRLFENCSKLETIYVGEYWDLYTRPNESDNAQCFSGCTSLVGGNPGYLTFLTATAM